MSDYTPRATIKEIDSPEPGWYKAITNFGTTCQGVRVKGTDTKFSVGQDVAVIQIGDEYGFDEILKSQLIVPGAVIPRLAKDCPASCALAVIASIAKNRRYYYLASVIEAANGKNVIVNGAAMQADVDGMKAGNGCLIEAYPGKPSRVLGYWQTVPSDNRVAVVFKRIKDTARVLIQLVQMSDYSVLKSALLTKYSATEYVDANEITILRTDSSFDYFYAHVYMFRNLGAAYEHHYIRLHKQDWTLEEISEGEYLYQESIQPAHTLTVDGHYWHHDNSFESYSRYIYTSEIESGTQIPVYKVPEPQTDPYFIPEYWLPDKGYSYTTIEESQ